MRSGVLLMRPAHHQDSTSPARSLPSALEKVRPQKHRDAPVTEADLARRVQVRSVEKYGWGDGLVVELTPEP